jgi:hypothetical protein
MRCSLDNGSTWVDVESIRIVYEDLAHPNTDVPIRAELHIVATGESITHQVNLPDYRMEEVYDSIEGCSPQELVNGITARKLL